MQTPLDTLGSTFPVLRNGDPVPDDLRAAVVAIGNFDGLHLGHQRLIAAATEQARASRRAAAILTFDPHPRAFFSPDDQHFRLTPEPVKLKILKALGLDAAFIRTFDRALAETSAADFIQSVVGRELGASRLVVGGDFHFGRGREGSPAMLKALAQEQGLAVTLVDTVQVEGAPVSSSRIRTALAAGRVGDANRLLGYRWFVAGEVSHGEKRGRELGYPTANVALPKGCALAHGIYAVRVATGPGAVWDGVASFGRRPTFDNGLPLLESFLFDFSGDLYGRMIEIEFVAHLRPEERFTSTEALVEQMDQDQRLARHMLAAATGRSFIG
ncbi:MAG: ribF [Enterovirga sp.]|nr:ribF [Enterovirga sp.]